MRVIFYGAAPMDKNTIIGYNQLGIDLIQGYGLTESSPVISAETDFLKRPGSVGMPLCNIEVKINKPNEDGIGEIIVKGPNIMLGYYQNKEKTREVLKDGWLYTGDYGYFDSDGFLYVTGRKKDIIVLSNGKNIYPQELEFLLNQIPCVIESIVFSRGKNSTDTALCAKIVYEEEQMKVNFPDKQEKDYHEILWQEVKKVNQKLPAVKHIKEIIITKQPLAKTTTQKVKRFEEIRGY